jgi:hypothetical protein
VEVDIDGANSVLEDGVCTATGETELQTVKRAVEVRSVALTGAVWLFGSIRKGVWFIYHVLQIGVARVIVSDGARSAVRETMVV